MNVKERVSLIMMTDIPLSEPKDKEEASPPSPPPPEDMPWLLAYKKLMGQSYELLYKLIDSTDWELIEDTTSTVSLHQLPNSDGFFTLKAQGIIEGRIERIIYINKDHNPETRLQWDKDVNDVSFLESYVTREGELCLVKSVVSLPPPIASRVSLGIMSHARTSDDTQVVIFRTTVNPRYEVPKDCVAVDAFSAVVVRDVGEGKCHIVVVAYVNPGGWIPSTIVNMYKEKVRKRIPLIEQTVARWNTYYGKKNTKN